MPQIMTDSGSVTFEYIKSLLTELDIEYQNVNVDKYGFSRTIQFDVYGITYRIVWFCNESKLLIGDGKRPAQVPFRYIYHDTTFPLVDSNHAIGFYYDKREKRHAYDSDRPYFSFRIPLEV